MASQDDVAEPETPGLVYLVLATAVSPGLLLLILGLRLLLKTGLIKGRAQVTRSGWSG